MKHQKQQVIAHILVLIAAVGLIIFIFISNTTSFKDKLFGSLFPKPSSHASGVVELSLSPAQTSIEVDSNVSLDIIVNPNGEQVSAAEIYIKFDPQKLQPVSLDPATIMPTVLVPASFNNDTATIVLGTGPGSSITQNGTPIAKLVFKTIQSSQTTTSVSLDSTTLVTALGKNENVVGLLGASQITINSVISPTPTPAVLPTAAPSSTPGTAGDRTPPEVSITSPLNGATVSRNSQLLVSATATDNIRVSKVEFWVEGRLESTDTSAPYSYNHRLTGKRGQFVISAKAYDQAGNPATDTVSVNVK